MSRIFEAIFRGGKSVRFPKVEPAQVHPPPPSPHPISRLFSQPTQNFRCGARGVILISLLPYTRTIFRFSDHIFLPHYFRFPRTSCHFFLLFYCFLPLLGIFPFHHITPFFSSLSHESGLQPHRLILPHLFRLQDSDNQQRRLGRILPSQ